MTNPSNIQSNIEYWEKLIRYHSSLLREAIDEYTAWHAQLEKTQDDQGNPD